MSLYLTFGTVLPSQIRHLGVSFQIQVLIPEIGFFQVLKKSMGHLYYAFVHSINMYIT